MATIENIELYTTMVLDVVKTWKKIYDNDEFWENVREHIAFDTKFWRSPMEEALIDLVEGVSERTVSEVWDCSSELTENLESINESVIKFYKGRGSDLHLLMICYMKEITAKMCTMKQMKAME